MNKHFSKKYSIARRTQNGGRFRLYAILIIFLLLCGTMFYSYKHQPASALATFYEKITVWLAERRHHLEKKANTKQAAVNQNDNEPQIHFEFYTALPNMQIAGSDLIAKKNHDLKKTSVKEPKEPKLEE